MKEKYEPATHAKVKAGRKEHVQRRLAVFQELRAGGKLDTLQVSIRGINELRDLLDDVNLMLEDASDKMALEAMVKEAEAKAMTEGGGEHAGGDAGEGAGSGSGGKEDGEEGDKGGAQGEEEGEVKEERENEHGEVETKHVETSSQAKRGTAPRGSEEEMEGDEGGNDDDEEVVLDYEAGEVDGLLPSEPAAAHDSGDTSSSTAATLLPTPSVPAPAPAALVARRAVLRRNRTLFSRNVPVSMSRADLLSGLGKVPSFRRVALSSPTDCSGVVRGIWGSGV